MARHPLDRLGLDRPELRAWALYDWANSAFFTTIVTAVFPDFFASVASSGVPPAVATTRFATATAIAVTVIALMAPVLGVLADRAGAKKRLLAAFAGIGIAATAAMAAIGTGDWMLAAGIFIVANIGMSGSLLFYDALLPHVARPEELDRVSAAGFALGYLGGGLLLAVNLAWILFPTTFGLSGPIAAIKLTFVSVAVWWALFTIPILRRVPEPRPVGRGRPVPLLSQVGAAVRGLRGTFAELRAFPQALLMLVAFLLYNDGIQTIIRMASIYGAEIGIGRDERIMAFVMVQFLGVPFALLFGRLADRVGAKPSLYVALVVYSFISCLGYFMSSAVHFFVLAALVATVQGGSQALSRSLFASLVPRQKSSEFFAFFSVFEKVAGVLGPALFAATTALTGSSRTAVLAVIAFFVTGGAVLSAVDVAKGRMDARLAEASVPPA